MEHFNLMVASRSIVKVAFNTPVNNYIKGINIDMGLKLVDSKVTNYHKFGLNLFIAQTFLLFISIYF
jgi:hypothetical protein